MKHAGVEAHRLCIPTREQIIGIGRICKNYREKFSSSEKMGFVSWEHDVRGGPVWRMQLLL